MWLYQSQLSDREAAYAEARNAKRLFRFPPRAVVSGSLRTPTLQLSFVRASHGQHAFRLTKPVDELANTSAIEDLILHMTSLPVETILTSSASPEDLAQWGLTPPPMELRVQLHDGTEHQLLIGPKNPLVDQYPVTDGLRSRVGLAFGTFTAAFERPLENYRSRHLLSLQPQEVAAVTVDPHEGEAFTLQRTTGGWEIQWTPGPHAEPETTRARQERNLPAPFPFGQQRRDPASKGRVQTYLRALADQAPIARFVSLSALPATADASFGLAPPWRTLTVTSTSGETERYSLGRGVETPPDADGRPWFIRRTGHNAIYEMTRAASTEVTRPARHFVDRPLIRLSPREVTQVDLYSASEGTHRVIRASPQADWTEGSSDRRALKSWRIDAIIRTMATLDGDHLLADAAEREQLRAWSLAPPLRRITFLAGEELLGELRIGKSWDDGYVICQGTLIKQVMLLTKSTLDVLPKVFDELIDKTSNKHP